VLASSSLLKRSLGLIFGVKDLCFFFFFWSGVGFYRGLSLGLVLHILKDYLFILGRDF
jgi:hypothetical protein